MSASLNSVDATEWNYRVFDKRLIIVKTKNESIRKIAALDVLTNFSFALEVPDKLLLDNLTVDMEYLANLKVYTSKNLAGIDNDFINFFEVVDIDQPIEDFIKAYWIYPSKIRFELVEVEQP
jgi:hypothetical protein